jgi:hypothetical protein
VNKGLAILMARIVSHPEEFQDYSTGRWAHLVNIVLDESRSGGFVTPAQREEFTKELNKVLSDTFTQSVLRKLLEYGYDSSGHLLVIPYNKGT